jgi:hypothetical protein
MLSPGQGGTGGAFPMMPRMTLLAPRPGFRPSGWQRFFFVLYLLAFFVSVVLGNAGFAFCYAILTLFFLLNTTDLDLFAPMSMVAQAFGIYFLLPLALIDERDPATLAYIACTLFLSLLIYLVLPRLNFGLGRRIGGGLIMRGSFLRTIIVMQVAGGVAFLISTRLAGFSNPLQVFVQPVKYRFFMMVGGMTYFTELIEFLMMAPALVIAVAFYMKKVSRRTCATVVATAAFYGVATGARGTVIMLLLEILLIRHVLFRRIKAGLVLFMACIVVPFVAIAGMYRTLQYEDRSGVLQAVWENLSVEDIVKAAFSRLDAAEMFNEFMVAEHHQEPKWGMSYLDAVAEVVPRSLWKDKPLLPNPEMTRIVGHNDPNLDISFDFGIFGETFLNFAWVGMLVGGLIIAIAGSLMQSVYDYAVSSRSPLAIITVAILCTVPLGLVVSGLVETSIVAIFSLLKILVLRKVFFRRLSASNVRARAAI